MDALALLCNLHADGPTTLHHLRTGGCESILDVMELDTEELEALLGWSERAILRFRREAAVLAERLEEGILESTAEEDFSAERVADDRSGHRGRAELPEDEDVRGNEKELLETWAALDEGSPPEEPDEPADPLELEEVPEEETPRRPLTPEACEGLTAEAVDRLARIGIETLDDLADGDTLEVSTHLGIGYTRVARLQFLARRHLASLEGATTREVEVIPANPPSGDRLEASGPFA